MSIDQEIASAIARNQAAFALMEAALRLALEKIDTLQRQLDDAEDELARARHEWRVS